MEKQLLHSPAMLPPSVTSEQEKTIISSEKIQKKWQIQAEGADESHLCNSAYCRSTGSKETTLGPKSHWHSDAAEGSEAALPAPPKLWVGVPWISQVSMRCVLTPYRQQTWASASSSLPSPWSPERKGATEGKQLETLPVWTPGSRTTEYLTVGSPGRD